MAVEIVPNVFFCCCCFVLFCFVFFRSKVVFLLFLSENIELQFGRKPQAELSAVLWAICQPLSNQDVSCSLLIHKVLLANRSHWAKQKRQDHGGKDCPPPRGCLGGGTLSPKKPLRSEEVLGVRWCLRVGPKKTNQKARRMRIEDLGHWKWK